MHDCCIRVTTLLQCFKWTLNKPHKRTGGMASTIGWGLTFGTISIYYDLICKGCIDTPYAQSLLVSKRGVVIVLLVIVK